MAIIFNFEEMGARNDKIIKALVQAFKKHTVAIVKESISVSPTKRSSGISFKELTLTTTDSQLVQFAVKQTGDIFRVKISSTSGRADSLKELPIKNQQDHDAAIKEIADKLTAQRKPFAAKLAKLQKNELAPEAKDKMKITTRQTEKTLQAAIAELDQALADADVRINELKQETAALAKKP